MNKFRQIYSKRGFTLVELIIVIAIIGVLAAILIPTMLNVVTSSKVASANSTSTSLKKSTAAFLTSADSEGWGMSTSNGNQCELFLTVNANGEWSCTAASAVFSSHSTISWGSAASGITSNTVGSSLTKGEERLCATLAAGFPKLKSASIMLSLCSGECAACAFSTDAGNAQLISGTDYPALVNGRFPQGFAWDGNTAGVTSTGIVVGTAPQVVIT